jgi:hypothetical protein
LGVGGWFFLPRFTGPREISHTIRISSEPSGAAIFLNGQDTGRVTIAQATVELPIQGYMQDAIALELRRDGFSPATATFSLDAEPPPPIDLRLESLAMAFTVTSDPPGAWVQIDGVRLEAVTPADVEISPDDGHELVVGKSGYTPRTFTIDPGGELPSEVITLAAIGKPGTLRVRSDYPLSLRSEGRTLASPSNAPTIELMAGRSTVTLYAPEVFLNRSVTVEIAEEETTTIQTPPLGKFSVRAFPGNCTFTVDGITSEAPPFDNKPIIVGRHTFVFEWPDGQKKTYEEEVVPGEPKYLIGRR